MAKGIPNSAAVQYQVHLKPTEIGTLVMKRMERPHLDKSAELRRFIELGYAAEQAGFILDGTVLRHAGRMWDTQPDISSQGLNQTGPAADKPLTERTRSTTDASTPEQGSSAARTEPVSSAPGEQNLNVDSKATTSLRANLRGISG
jgi:hypothetical protein